ncbi:hypothetical protein J3F83DRAFT_724186 [Trichoderma novae-zelandiae]
MLRNELGQTLCLPEANIWCICEFLLSSRTPSSIMSTYLRRGDKTSSVRMYSIQCMHLRTRSTPTESSSRASKQSNSAPASHRGAPAKVQTALPNKCHPPEAPSKSKMAKPWLRASNIRAPDRVPRPGGEGGEGPLRVALEASPSSTPTPSSIRAFSFMPSLARPPAA